MLGDTTGSTTMRIFIAGSSRDTCNPAYNVAAATIGGYVAATPECQLVFGGCKFGLMGKVYAPVAATGKSDKIIIAISQKYVADLDGLLSGMTITCSNLRDRKHALIAMADVLIFLPGGPGTYDELFTAIETKRSGEHNNPIIIVNIDNHYEHFLGMLKRAENDRFADNYEGILYHVVNSASDAIALLSQLQK